MKIINSIIIFIVITLVMGSAFLIVERSLVSDVSNFSLLQGFIDKHYGTKIAIGNVASADTLSKGLILTRENPCDSLALFPGNDSLIDFLKSQGLKSSLSFRKELAKEAGIHNYSGLQRENLTMLNYLIEDLDMRGSCNKAEKALHFPSIYGRVENTNESIVSNYRENNSRK